MDNERNEWGRTRDEQHLWLSVIAASWSAMSTWVSAEEKMSLAFNDAHQAVAAYRTVMMGPSKISENNHG